MNVLFLNDKEENTNIKLDNVYLSSHNPRYTLWKFDEKEEQYLVGNSIVEEKSTIRKLFISEGFLNEFIDLLESIEKYGFKNDKKDPIILIKIKNKHNKFVVAEGNRRIMALKFIMNPSLLPDVNSITTNVLLNEKQESLLNNGVDDDTPSVNEKDNYPDNYNKVKEIIERLNKIDLQYKVYYEVEKDYSNLVSSIYSKHVTGERIGLRRWPRSKYYADLLYLFPCGINTEDDNTIKILSNFQRKINDIINDYKQAQYVYKSFFYYHTDKNEEYKLNNSSILDEMINNRGGVSALEKSHSFNKFKKSVMNLTMITSNQFDEEYISFSSLKKDNYFIKAREGKLKERDVFNFIYSQWFSGILNTRELGNKTEDFEYSVKQFIESNKIYIDDFYSLEELNNINEFEIPENKRSNLIKINNIKYPNEMKRFKIAADIIKTKKKMPDLFKPSFIAKYKEYNKILDKIDNSNPENLKGIPPIFVFYILLKQYTDTKVIYLNSLSSTLRAFIEQFIIWISDIHFNRIFTKDLNIHENKNLNRMHEVPIEHKGDNIANYDIATGSNIQRRVKTFLNECKTKIKKADIIETIEYMYLPEYKKTATEDVEVLLNQYWKEDGNGDYTILCEFIHANHRIYVQSEYIENLKLFDKYQNFVFEIYNKLDLDKLMNTNEYIKKYASKD